MPRRKADLPGYLRANRIGCFVIAAAIAAIMAVTAYIGLNSPSENAQNSVIPTIQ